MVTHSSRSFEEIRSAYEDNPDAAGLEGPVSRNCDGDTLLHLAASRGNLADVRDLIALGSAINARGDLGLTALHYAAMGGHATTAEAFLALGADRLAPDEFGQTPAKVATLASHKKLADLLRPSHRRPRKR